MGAGFTLRSLFGSASEEDKKLQSLEPPKTYAGLTANVWQWIGLGVAASAAIGIWVATALNIPPPELQLSPYPPTPPGFPEGFPRSPPPPPSPPPPTPPPPSPSPPPNPPPSPPSPPPLAFNTTQFEFDVLDQFDQLLLSVGAVAASAGLPLLIDHRYDRVAPCPFFPHLCIQAVASLAASVTPNAGIGWNRDVCADCTEFVDGVLSGELARGTQVIGNIDGVDWSTVQYLGVAANCPDNLNSFGIFHMQTCVSAPGVSSEQAAPQLLPRVDIITGHGAGPLVASCVQETTARPEGFATRNCINGDLYENHDKGCLSVEDPAVPGGPLNFDSGEGTTEPWIRIDLGSTQNIQEVKIYNRDVSGSAGIVGRLGSHSIIITDVESTVPHNICPLHLRTEVGNGLGIQAVRCDLVCFVAECPRETCVGRGRFVYLVLPGTARHIGVREIEIYGAPRNPCPDNVNYFQRQDLIHRFSFDVRDMTTLGEETVCGGQGVGSGVEGFLCPNKYHIFEVDQTSDGAIDGLARAGSSQTVRIEWQANLRTQCRSIGMITMWVGSIPSPSPPPPPPPSPFPPIENGAFRCSQFALDVEEQIRTSNFEPTQENTLSQRRVPCHNDASFNFQTAEGTDRSLCDLSSPLIGDGSIRSIDASLGDRPRIDFGTVRYIGFAAFCHDSFLNLVDALEVKPPDDLVPGVALGPTDGTRTGEYRRVPLVCGPFDVASPLLEDATGGANKYYVFDAQASVLDLANTNGDRSLLTKFATVLMGTDQGAYGSL